MISINRTIDCPFAKENLIKKILNTVMRTEGKFKTSSTLITVTLTDDLLMKKLNHLWRKKKTTTDILSFNINEPEGNVFHLGELYISIPALLKQAPLYGNSPVRELVLLLIHGCLHLHGYDHETDATPRQTAAMSKKENAYRKLLVTMK
jgi:probable rRNA maturation factor